MFSRSNAKIYIERYLLFCAFLSVFFVLTFFTNFWRFGENLAKRFYSHDAATQRAHIHFDDERFRAPQPHSYEEAESKRRRRQLRDGEWALWTAWTPCAVNNEIGRSVQTRTRACNGGGGNCEGGESNQARACLLSDSPPAYAIAPPTGGAPSSAFAEWRAWSEWTECHSPPPGQLGAPYRTRWRECDRNRCYGASNRADCQPCAGDAYEQAVCGNSPNAPDGREYPEASAPLLYDATRPLISPRQYENCQWSPWSIWSSCSATCGRNARRYRARTCSCAVRHGCGLGSPIEDEMCAELPNCAGGGYDPAAAALSPFYNPPPPPPPPQTQPRAGTSGLGYPCNMCPPRYPFPCYTCISLQDPRGG